MICAWSHDLCVVAMICAWSHDLCVVAMADLRYARAITQWGDQLLDRTTLTTVSSAPAALVPIVGSVVQRGFNGTFIAGVDPDLLVSVLNPQNLTTTTPSLMIVNAKSVMRCDTSTHSFRQIVLTHVAGKRRLSIKFGSLAFVRPSSFVPAFVCA
jgi:hypothetical protein